MMVCKKHPRYRGVRRPRHHYRGRVVDFCQGCENVYQSTHVADDEEVTEIVLPIDRESRLRRRMG